MAVALREMDFSVFRAAGSAAFTDRVDVAVVERAALFDAALSIDLTVAVPVPAFVRLVADTLVLVPSARLPTDAVFDRKVLVSFASEAWDFAVFFIALAMS